MNTTPPVFLVATSRTVCAAWLCLAGARAGAQSLPPPLAGFQPSEKISEADVRLRLSPQPRDEAAAAPSVHVPAPAPAAQARPADIAAPAKVFLPATYGFGPVFGNNEREPDPNYMPPPLATGPEIKPPPATPAALYTRVSQTNSGVTTWLGNNGSEIRYLRRAGAGENGAAETARPADDDALIAENRQEMTKLSWAQVRRRFPELTKEDGPERAAFDAFLLARRSSPQTAYAFESPRWPESLAVAFYAEREWKRAEAASWERARARAPELNDPESAFTRSFLGFADGLRSSPEGAALLKEPNWPERVLELQEQRARGGARF